MDVVLIVNPNWYPTNGLDRKSLMLDDFDSMFLRIFTALMWRNPGELLS